MQTTPETEQVTCCSACLLVPYLYPYDARGAARARAQSAASSDLNLRRAPPVG